VAYRVSMCHGSLGAPDASPLEVPFGSTFRGLFNRILEMYSRYQELTHYIRKAFY
jgi:hypothetical protein